MNPTVPKREQPTKADLYDIVVDELHRSIYKPNILSYVPYGAQVDFHKSTKMGRILTAGNRAGKSDAMVVEFIRVASNTDPDKPRPAQWGPGPVQLRIVVVDITKGVEGIMLPKFKRWMTPTMLVGGSWAKSWDRANLTLTFSNGSTIDFLTYGMTLDKHAGVPRHMIGFDEEPPREIFNEALMRLLDYDGVWVIAATPLNGMDWIYDLLVEPSMEGELEYVEVFELNPDDNPYLLAKNRSRFMVGMDKEEREIRGEGKYVARSGLVFPKFKDNLSKFVLEEAPDPKKYVREGWAIYSSVDHGWNNPTAWLWIGVNRYGECEVFAEHYASNMTVPQHAKIVLEKEREWGISEDLIQRSGDPAMKQVQGATGVSYLQIYADCGVHIGVETIPRDVMIGVEKLQEYLGFTPDRLPALRISPNCPHLIRELKKLRWATYDSEKTAYSKNKQEVIQKVDDHAADSLRYWATQMPDLTPESSIDLPRDQIVPTTIPFADLIARMRDGGEVEFVDDRERTWNVSESFGDYYEEEEVNEGSY